MGNPKNYENPNNDQKFIIIMSIGKPKGKLYREIDQFRRKSLDKISDKVDEKLVPAQFAPSASNTQPWYFTHNDDGSYDLYRVKLGMLRSRVYGKWNRIDTGIALAHLYVANKDSFKFYMKDNPEEHKGLFYAGSFEI